MMNHRSSETVMMRKRVSRILLPNDIPNAIPLFSTNAIWNQLVMVICSPKAILVFTSILIIWSIMMTSRMMAILIITCFLFTPLLPLSLL